MMKRGLWMDILASKYDSWRCLDINNNNNNESRLWRHLKSICGKGKEGKCFNENLRWRVGEENNIFFAMIVGLDKLHS